MLHMYIYVVAVGHCCMLLALNNFVMSLNKNLLVTPCQTQCSRHHRAALIGKKITEIALSGLRTSLICERLIHKYYGLT